MSSTPNKENSYCCPCRQTTLHEKKSEGKSTCLRCGTDKSPNKRR